MRTSINWVYEIVDRANDSQVRTTGGVALHLFATTKKNTVYLLCDSVLTINLNLDATSAEVRLAMCHSIFLEDWGYQTPDVPDKRDTVAEYAKSILIISEESQLHG